MRKWRAFWLLVLVVSLLPHTTTAQDNNLLQNGDLERPYYAQGSPRQTTPNGWQIWIGEGNPDAQLHNAAPQVASGTASWVFSQSNAGFLAAGYQQVTGLAPNTPLRFSAQGWLFACNDATTNCIISEPPYLRSDASTHAGLKVGLDPLGGTDPLAESVAWSREVAPYDQWIELEVLTTSVEDTVTVFLFMEQQEDMVINEFYWDSAALVITGEGAGQPTPTVTDTITPYPTETPITTPTNTEPPPATAAITATATATNTAVATETATAEGTEATPSLTVTNTITPFANDTPVTETPTLTPAPPTHAAETPVVNTPPALVSEGTLCLTVYDDSNTNGAYEEGEGTLSGVGVQVSPDLLEAPLETGEESLTCVNLPPRQYEISVQLPAEYGLTTTPRILINLLSGRTITVRFGAAEGYTPPATPAFEEDPDAPEPTIEPGLIAPLFEVQVEATTTPEDEPETTVLDNLYDKGTYVLFGLAVVVAVIGAFVLILMDRPTR